MLKPDQKPRGLYKDPSLQQPVDCPKKLVSEEHRTQKSNCEESEDVSNSSVPVESKFIDLLLQVLTSYATVYEAYGVNAFGIDVNEVALLDFLTHIETTDWSALKRGRQSELKRVLLFVNKVIETLKTDENFRDNFQSALNDNFGASKTSLAEKWMMAWFSCKNNTLGIAKMWLMLYRKAFPDVGIPSKYSLFMVHACQNNALQLVGFAMWVSETEGSMNALMGCSFLQEFIKLHYHNPSVSDQFIKTMSLISADQLCNEFYRYMETQKKSTLNFPYQADFKDILYRSVKILDAPELFRGIYASLGVAGLQNLLFLMSGQANIDARNTFNQFIRDDSVVPLYDKVKLFQFALVEKTGRAWSLLEKIFVDDAYQLFYQGVPQALLMLRNDLLQLARFSDNVLLETLDEFDTKNPSHGVMMIIHLYRNLATQDRPYQEINERLERIYSYFDVSEFNSWSFPIVSQNASYSEATINGFLTSCWKRLIGVERCLLKHELNIYEELASSSPTTFIIMMNYFCQHMNIEERCNFIHKKIRLDKSIFSIAVQHPDLLQTLLSSFFPPVSEPYQLAIQPWISFAYQLKKSLNSPLLGRDGDYLGALKFYITLLTLIQSVANERDLTEKFCSVLCQQSDVIRRWVAQFQLSTFNFIKKSSEHELCNLSFSTVKNLSFFSNTAVSSNHSSQEGFSPFNSLELSSTS